MRVCPPKRRLDRLRYLSAHPSDLRTDKQTTLRQDVHACTGSSHLALSLQCWRCGLKLTVNALLRSVAVLRGVRYGQLPTP